MECLLIFAMLFLTTGVSGDSSIVMGRTSWGDWTTAIECSPGERVTGFQLRVQRPCGTCDDTALNGIQLACSDHRYTLSIPGYWGNWLTWQHCNPGEHITQFQMRSEPGRGASIDDTAGNDVNMFCSDGKTLYGGGNSWGTWEGWRECPKGEYLCGLKAKLEGPQGTGDDTALNEIDFRCCKHPSDEGLIN